MMSAADRWKQRVETHHAQSLGAQEDLDLPDDFWRPFASAFRADPHRTDDDLVNRLVREVSNTGTVLDVGGGAGRLALPLALRCRHVTVVEPSASMIEELRNVAKEAGIENLTVVERNWEDVDVRPVDVVLCAHVVYGVAEIVPFVGKLNAGAKGRALLLVYMDAPQSQLSPFWKPAHGEERIDLPALPELLEVLWEMAIYPDVEMLETGRSQSFESRDSALDTLRQRLYVAPGSEKARRLEAAADELLVDTRDGVAIRGAGPRRQALVSWRPE